MNKFKLSIITICILCNLLIVDKTYAVRKDFLHLNKKYESYILKKKKFNELEKKLNSSEEILQSIISNDIFESEESFIDYIDDVLKDIGINNYDIEVLDTEKENILKEPIINLKLDSTFEDLDYLISNLKEVKSLKILEIEMNPDVDKISSRFKLNYLSQESFKPILDDIVFKDGKDPFKYKDKPLDDKESDVVEDNYNNNDFDLETEIHNLNDDNKFEENFSNNNPEIPKRDDEKNTDIKPDIPLVPNDNSIKEENYNISRFNEEFMILTYPNSKKIKNKKMYIDVNKDKEKFKNIGFWMYVSGGKKLELGVKTLEGNEYTISEGISQNGWKYYKFIMPSPEIVEKAYIRTKSEKGHKSIILISDLLSINEK